jgi:hypothetical protein
MGIEIAAKGDVEVGSVDGTGSQVEPSEPPGDHNTAGRQAIVGSYTTRVS